MYVVEGEGDVDGVLDLGVVGFLECAVFGEVVVGDLVAHDLCLLFGYFGSELIVVDEMVVGYYCVWFGEYFVFVVQMDQVVLD